MALYGVHIKCRCLRYDGKFGTLVKYLRRITEGGGGREKKKKARTRSDNELVRESILRAREEKKEGEREKKTE